MIYIDLHIINNKEYSLSLSTRVCENTFGWTELQKRHVSLSYMTLNFHEGRFTYIKIVDIYNRNRVSHNSFL